MKRLTLLALALLALSATSGCNLWKKSAKPKENPDIAAEVESTFRQRWTDRRVAELVAKGTDAAAAKQQADTEFKERFGFTGAAGK